MVLVRRGLKTVRKAATGDTLPEPKDELQDLRIRIRQLKAARAAVTPRERLRNLQRQVEERVVAVVEDQLRRSDAADERITRLRQRLRDRERKPVEKFFMAAKEALLDPNAGGVLSTKRLGTLLKELGEDQ